MKKNYEAPKSLFEDFALSSSIAVGCEFINKNPTQGSCGYQTEFGVVFTTQVSGCKYTAPDTNDSLCYHVPNDYANIFTS